MNCMALKDIGSMYARLLEELPQRTSKKGKKALKGKAAVEQLLENLAKRWLVLLPPPMLLSYQPNTNELIIAFLFSTN